MLTTSADYESFSDFETFKNDRRFIYYQKILRTKCSNRLENFKLRESERALLINGNFLHNYNTNFARNPLLRYLFILNIFILITLKSYLYIYLFIYK